MDVLHPRKIVKDQMLNFQMQGSVCGGFCLGMATALTVWALSGAALAGDGPGPTYLESGSNDLIQFQKGGVPTPEITALAQSSAARKAKQMTNAARVQKSPNLKSLGIARSDKPMPGAGLLQSAPPELPEASSDAAVASSAAPQAEMVQKKQRARGGVRSLPPAASPEAPQPPLEEDIDLRLVTICLTNPEHAQGPKGFDIRRDGLPRYVAEVGEMACARFEPTRQMLYFWKADGSGELTPTLSSRLDLNDSDGTLVTLEWLRDH
ncbi:hypothetical protein DYI23_20190 [Roseibium polysiphoniae]|uniref:Uncharacterized protein n=2 Tax=Roseibium polysiphoniae TaxID=2571221 RepID=A0A944CFU5_9HYPH|nr:hypothetical protein [Roseibium polysiphoniae]